MRSESPKLKLNIACELDFTFILHLHFLFYILLPASRMEIEHERDQLIAFFM